MKSFYIIRGLPGSGKSTTAKQIGHPIEADQYFLDPQGNYNFDATKLHLAHKDCFERTVYALVNLSPRSVVVSNTFTTKKELRPYFELAKKHGVKPQVITCQGQFGSIHGVPQEKLDQMKARFDFKCVDELFQEYFSE